MKELWKSIRGYEGIYEINDFGNVKSLERVIERKGKGKILKNI